MYKNHSYNNREELNQCNKLNRDNTEKLKIQRAKRNKVSISIHIYIDITADSTVSAFWASLVQC